MATVPRGVARSSAVVEGAEAEKRGGEATVALWHLDRPSGVTPCHMAAVGWAVGMEVGWVGAAGLVAAEWARAWVRKRA